MTGCKIATGRDSCKKTQKFCTVIKTFDTKVIYINKKCTKTNFSYPYCQIYGKIYSSITVQVGLLLWVYCLA